MSRATQHTAGAPLGEPAPFRGVVSGWQCGSLRVRVARLSQRSVSELLRGDRRALVGAVGSFESTPPTGQGSIKGRLGYPLL